MCLDTWVSVIRTLLHSLEVTHWEGATRSAQALMGLGLPTLLFSTIHTSSKLVQNNYKFLLLLLLYFPTVQSII
ncbi:hypothetical protein BHM03_00025113 [Ensete ventricosum]|nr:hypothetical protein BHM03_00025113 [Ensete ventricosum]